MSDEELSLQMKELEMRIPFDSDIFETRDNYERVLYSLLKDSLNIALETLFPYDDFSAIQLPKKYYNWQIRCCIELYNLADKQGVTSYSESSLSWSKLTDGLSRDLMSKLTSKVGIPKRSS